MTRWPILLAIAGCAAEPRPAPVAVAPVAIAAPPAPVDAGPRQPTRRLPGPCEQRIAWAIGGEGRVRHGYDAAGRLELTEWDGDGDGKVTRRFRYHYPAVDRVVIEVDARADGSIEHTTETAYTDNAALYAELCADPTARCERDGHGNILTISSEDGDAIALDYACWPP